ncbi:hypothetical protein SH528x_001148 [Novipirellula sp. SH528]|uniref:hypothetical protein n=1 Tax=Novipirellula sp. SH528 TaxID=3454466 RepID=UPI003F9FE164
MSETKTLANTKPAALRWRLWVDGCGGFLILSGQDWSVGGASSAATTDVRIHSDLPRVAGTISRHEDSYFWDSAEPKMPADLMLSGRPLPIPGSASLIFRQPSPLSRSGVLTLKPPHRFDGHVDGVILADETLLIGSTTDCHVQANGMGSERIVMTRRADQWFGKVVGDTDLSKLIVGSRIELGGVEMTLENA